MAFSQRFAFIGGGKMGEGLIRALLDSGLLTPAQMAGSDIAPKARAALSALGVRAVADNRAAAEGADVILIAVLPRIVPAVAAELRDIVTPQCLIVSIAAGVPTAAIEACLAPGVPVVRVR